MRRGGPAPPRPPGRRRRSNPCPRRRRPASRRRPRAAQRAVRHRRPGAVHQGLVAECGPGPPGRPPPSPLGSGRRARQAACSATTNAMATSVVWVRERWKSARTLRPGQHRRATVQHEGRRVARGARPGDRHTSTSVSAKAPRPVRAPSSRPPWRRSAPPGSRPVGDRTASARSVSVKQRSASRGRRSSTRRKRSTSTASTPTPTMALTGAHSTVTVLARLRGRSGSWPCSRARR